MKARLWDRIRGKYLVPARELTRARVILLVRDPRGTLTSATDTPRTQLTSNVDIAPLLLTIATGSNAWRRDAHYAHLAGRHDLASVLADPSAPGRPYVLHATDEIVTEFAIEPYDASAPLHVVGLRTPSFRMMPISSASASGRSPDAPIAVPSEATRWPNG